MHSRITNSIQARLAAGELALGLGVRVLRHVEIVGLAVAGGYDWLFIDLEHGAVSLESVAQISNTAILAGCAPIVRVPRLDVSTASRALDSGALGVIFPHVATADEAQAIVNAVRFPPVGNRSFAARQPIVGFAARPALDVMIEIEAKILVFAMIETAEGVENVEDIAAVAGIDVLFIGTNDLAIGLGIPDAFETDQFGRVLDRIVAAGRKHGKLIGIGGLQPEEQLRRQIGAGVSIVLGDMETSLIVKGGHQQTSKIRNISQVTL
jgi:2-keto-3-deoxy-L-rhamnonate aldolase RhmA